MIGSLLAGRYRLDAEIGQGGMATVYRAFDRSLERPVAVKVLRAELAQDPEIVARFRAEAQAAARLSHPNIVQIFDTGEDSGHHFLVMEFLPEPDLKSIIRNYAPLPVHKAAEVAIQACEALGYAHQHGLIHRDVKPHNILFTSDGRAKLADFGIAAAAGEHLGPTSLLGSAHYLSPEEIHGNAPTPQSDLFSLGVVMYECLTGRTPYQGETAEAVLSKRISSPPPAPRSLNPTIPPSAEHVVLKAMARDLNQRYRSAGEMLADLRPLAAGAPLVVDVPRPSSEATQTMVLPRPAGQTVSSPILREAPPGPRRPPPAPAKEEAGPGWAWGVAGFVLGTIALVALVVLLRYLFYPGGQAPAFVQVPGVTGLSRQQAEQALRSAGLTVGAVTNKASPQAAPGTVLDQKPAMAARVPKNTAVDLVLAVAAPGQQEVVPVPDVVGQRRQKAIANLQMLGLQVGQIEEVADKAPADEVLKQGVKPGTKVAKGQTVDLTVSKGPEQPTEPTVPPEGTEPTKTGADEGAQPKVDVQPDPTYSSADPAQKRFIVTVEVRGKKPGQKIEILQRDEKETGLVVHSGKHDPGDVIKQAVLTVGTPTLEVRWEGTLVERYP